MICQHEIRYIRNNYSSFSKDFINKSGSYFVYKDRINFLCSHGGTKNFLNSPTEVEPIRSNEEPIRHTWKYE
jgi:hypothetical protein